MMKKILFVFFLFVHFLSYGQYTGARPYSSQFGPNQVVLNSGANWEVTNTDEHDMIFAIVNLRDKVIAHSYIKASETYMFKDLPIGTYYFKFENNGSFFEDKELMRFEGCDPEVYICNSYVESSMSINVYTRPGSVSPGEISKKDFFNN